MRALTIEWLEHNGVRARLIGILISDNSEVRFHVKTWPKKRGNVARFVREEVWTFDQIAPFVRDSSRTFQLGMKAWM